MASLLKSLENGAMCMFKCILQRPREVVLDELVRMVVEMRLVGEGKQEEQEVEWEEQRKV